MKLFSEQVNHTSTNSSHNILQVESFDEIFFDVFEIEINKSKYPVEKISSYNGNPVVSVPVVSEGVEVFYPFILTKGEFQIIFNENNTFENCADSLQINIEDGEYAISRNVLTENTERESPQIEEDDVNHFHDTINELKGQIVEISEQKQSILNQIEEAKRQAKIKIDDYKKRSLKESSDQIKSKNRILKQTLDTARDSLVNEFVDISSKIKSELFDVSSEQYSELKETIDNKITSLSDELKESLHYNLDQFSNIFDSKLKDLIKELYKSSVIPKVETELSNIAKQIVEKVDLIESNLENKFNEVELNLDKKLEEKAEASTVENVSKQLEAIQDANIELNDNINKGVNKALSRAGNVKNLVEKLTEDINKKIDVTEENITAFYNEKIDLLREQHLDLADEARNYYISLISENKESILKEIAKLKTEAPVEYIIETNGTQTKKDFNSIEKDWDTKIKALFENYKVDLRKYVAVYAAGGGTNATQYQDGGVMNGNLTVVGAISASQYLGIPSGSASGAYLPLSGGTVTGDVNVIGALSADSIQFNTAVTLSSTNVGQLIWNDVDGTLNLGLKGGNVTLQLGQEQLLRVVNKTGGDLLESEYRAVRVTGATGQRISIELAQASNDANSATTIGIVTESIANNQEGFITTMGEIHEINTTGSIQGENWNDGDTIYLSPITPGWITNVKPQAPYHTIMLGYVEYAHAIHGKIFVHIQNGYELEELHNVRIVNPQNNDVLQYNSLSSIWSNKNEISITGLSADRIYTTQLDALSANISVIDIKQYELSGFNVTGNCTIQGSVSSSGALYGSNLIYNMGNTNGSAITIGTNDNYGLNFETAGVTRIAILSSGNITFNTRTMNSNGVWTNPFWTTDGLYIGTLTNGTSQAMGIDSGGITMRSNAALNWGDNTNFHGSPSVTLLREGTGILSQRLGLNSQEFRLYNTYTSATSAERATFKFVNNNFAISTESLPLSGGQRSMLFQTGSATSMTLLSTGEVNFSGNGNITMPYTKKILTTGGKMTIGAAEAYSVDIVAGANGAWVAGTFTNNNFGNNMLYLGGGVGFGMNSAGSLASNDVSLIRSLTGTLEQRAGTTSQTFNIYNTYTSATSAERATFKFVNNDFVIGTEALPLSGPQRATLFQTGSSTRIALQTTGAIDITPATNTQCTVNTSGNGYFQVTGGNGIACNSYNTYGPNTLSINSSQGSILLNSGSGVVELRSSGANSTSRSLNIYNTYTSATSAERATFKFDTNGDFIIGAESVPLSAPQRSMVFQTASATRMTILSSGNVGIGTTTPTQGKLVIDSTTQFANRNLVFQQTAGASSQTNEIVWRSTFGNIFDYAKIVTSYGNSYTSSYFTIQVANSALALQSRLHINTVGNVGIGTTTPNERLTVSGNISASGNITSNSNYVVTASLSSDKTANSGTDTPILFNYIKADPNTWVSGVTATRITPTVPGYYSVTYQVSWRQGIAGVGNQNNIQILKNNVTASIAQQPINSSDVSTFLNTTAIVYLNGSTDYVNFQAYSSNLAQVIGGPSDGNWTKVELFKIN